MHKAHPLPVLFAHFGDQWLRGSETVLLDLLSHFDPTIIRPIVWTNNVELAEFCRKIGYVFYHSSFEYYFDYSSPKFRLEIYRAEIQEAFQIVERHSIRLMHSNGAAPTQWLLPVARTKSLPLLTHLHTHYLRRSRYVLLLHQADLIVGVSNHAIQALRDDDMPTKRLEVIYNGIDFKRLSECQRSNLRAALHLREDTVLIGAAGSLIARKGYDVLLQAISLLAEHQPHVAIAGSGPEEPALLEQAARLGLKDRVHFLGYYPHIADIYSSCDVFVGPSREESFGLVFAEAGYFGCPVIATRVGGVPEVVLDRETGLLIPPDDAEALCDALAQLLQDAALRCRLGSAGRQRAKEHFTAERMASAFTADYLRLAKLPRSKLGWGSLIGRFGPYQRLLRR